MTAPELLNPIARVTLEKFMVWDRVERCWELVVPFPKHIVVDPKLHPGMKGANPFEAMLEVAEIIEATEGLSYNNMGVDNETGEFSVVGLAWD